MNTSTSPSAEKLLLTERYTQDIKGALSCFDRIMINGHLPDVGYDQAMEA